MNPWGSGEWTGKWSDSNTHGEWTAEMIKAVGKEQKDDGKFWMSIEDFVANTAGVEYSRTFGPNWKKVTQYSHFQSGHSMVATAIQSYEARDNKELSLRKGDQIEISTFANTWWSGAVEGKQGFFPHDCVHLNHRPVARFDLHCSKKNPEEPAVVVIMLLQPNTMQRRRWYSRKEDGLHYKDIHYPRIELVVVNPQGDTVIKREAQQRCLWGELENSGSGRWTIYATSTDGKGSQFSVRVYMKNVVQASLREVPADISELEAFL